MKNQNCVERMLSKYFSSNIFNYKEKIVADPFLLKNDIIDLFNKQMPVSMIGEMETSLSSIESSIEDVSYEVSNLKSSAAEMQIS